MYKLLSETLKRSKNTQYNTINQSKLIKNEGLMSWLKISNSIFDRSNKIYNIQSHMKSLQQQKSLFSSS